MIIGVAVVKLEEISAFLKKTKKVRVNGRRG